jgi:hypothetical protein
VKSPDFNSYPNLRSEPHGGIQSNRAMAPSLAFRVSNQFRAAWKFCLSFIKREWELRDYPVSTREQEIDSTYSGTRLKQHRYLSFIVNWGLGGAGDTQAEAFRELETAFETAKRNRPFMPRPGTRVPIEFATQERVSAHPELAEDFIRRVLELKWAWISDESSLWDFHKDETNDALYAKIDEVYGVDVSDIKSAKLSEILERIATVRKPEGNG